ncbi:MAG: hypothetical protein ACSHXK_04280 [Oceanococcus sp.]
METPISPERHADASTNPRESQQAARKRRALRLILDPLYKWRRYARFDAIISESFRGTRFENQTIEAIENYLIGVLDKIILETDPVRLRVHEAYFEKAIEILAPRTEKVVAALRNDYRINKQIQTEMEGRSGQKLTDPELLRLNRIVNEVQQRTQHLQAQWEKSTSFNRKHIETRLMNARGLLADARESLYQYQKRTGQYVRKHTVS